MPSAAIRVERLGGLGGFGLPGSRLRSEGQVDPAGLPPAARAQVERLFGAAGAPGARPAARSPGADRFRYRLTRTLGHTTTVIEVAEDQLPREIIDCVRDELR